MMGDPDKQDGAERGAPEDKGRSKRVLTAIVLCSIIFAIAFPWHGSGGPVNILRGPLAFAGSKSSEETVAGVLVAVVCLGMCVCMAVWPNRASDVVVIVATVLWFAFGFFAVVGWSV
jgi:hypothetical protein